MSDYKNKIFLVQDINGRMYGSGIDEKTDTFFAPKKAQHSKCTIGTSLYMFMDVKGLKDESTIDINCHKCGGDLREPPKC